MSVPIAAAVEGKLEDRLEHIGAEIRRRRIDKIVVGYPLNMDGSAGEMTKRVDAFIDDISKRFNIPVDRCDERLSSFQAACDLRAISPRAGGRSVASRKKYRRSGDIDSRSIALVLQDYIDNGMRADKKEF